MVSLILVVNNCVDIVSVQQLAQSALGFFSIKQPARDTISF